MLSKDQIKSITDKVMSISTGDETEAYVSSHRSSLTRFAENHIHQNVSEEDVGLSVSVIFDGRMGEASTNKIGDASIKKTVENASEIAKLAPKDDELLPRLGPQKYKGVQAYDPEIDEITPMDRAKGVLYMIELCEQNGFKAAGAVSDSSGSGALANSKGLFAYHKRSGINYSATAMGDTGSGWVERSSHRRADIDMEKLAHIAVDKAIESQNPKEIPPGKYTVILEPHAASELIGFMLGGFNALAVDEGRSFLTDKIGKKIVGDYISMYSDPYHPLQQGYPFDGDGVPTRKVELIKNGVASNLVYDRLTAKKHDVDPTGHGGGGRNAYGAYPSSPVIEGGKATIEEMISSTDKGILVTRFWYTNFVDPMQVIVTGMTRDGTFWIENGRIAYGIKNFRINQNVLEMLNNVEMMSEPVLADGIVVPAMKIRDFNFSSGSDAI